MSDIMVCFEYDVIEGKIVNVYDLSKDSDGSYSNPTTAFAYVCYSKGFQQGEKG